MDSNPSSHRTGSVNPLDFLPAQSNSSVNEHAGGSSSWAEISSTMQRNDSSGYTPEATSPINVRHPISSPIPRPLPQRRVASASHVPTFPIGEQLSPSSTFESPLRSIFASGPPTSSVSASTALASLSAAATSPNSGPFAALTSAGASRRPPLRSGDSTPTATSIAQSNGVSLLNTEKDIDDPNIATASGPGDSNSLNTSTSLARLFVASNGTSPGPFSRGNSDLRTFSTFERAVNDASTLSGHLLHRGFVEGRHSDITIYAFGETYKLHKLLLDRVPFFSSAFSGSWAESSASEMTLVPEEIDPNISKTAFELALKRIYGTQFPPLEDQEAIGLFATACWLDMPDLVDSCVESILRQMHTSTLHYYIKLVTSNYYGKAGDRILSSAKAMLCREGWEMPYEYWDSIPANIAREIIGGDPFFVPSEWERWLLTVRLLNRRLKAAAVDVGLISPGGKYLQPKPTNLKHCAIRADTIFLRESGHKKIRSSSNHDDAWIALYLSPEISPLYTLLDEGIHYIHLRFEQLQQIRSHKDILGVPILPEKVISDALWMSMELRQRVLNAQENDLELGLSQLHEMEEPQFAKPTSTPESERQKSKQKEEYDLDVEHLDEDGSIRKFWIPSNDISCVMGGTRDAYFGGNSTSSPEWNVHASRSTTNSPGHVENTWSSEFTLDSSRLPTQTITGMLPPRYSHFPPFRFSAEFPNPRTLKEKKRVYSQTVWYAGSMWNLYIQRVNTSKNQQLGIYLHRAKDKDSSDDPLAQFVPASVDDRIGQLEREMLLRKSERRHRHWLSNGSDMDSHEELRTILPEYEGTGLMPTNQPGSSAIRLSTTLEGGSGTDTSRKTSQSATDPRANLRRLASENSQVLDSEDEDEELLQASRRYNVPAIPPYLDARPVIKTYFKIYSPDKAGRLLSIYESAPEKFVVSKSWGWKSSQMVLDEGISGYDVTKSIKEGKLRYMVVIGNV